MKIKVGKEKIRDAVKIAASAADRRGAIPILSNILFEAEDNTLRLTATNLEIGASTLIDCEVEEPGRATVNASKAAKLFSSLTGQEITLEGEENRVVVKSANAKFSLASLPPEEFPEIELPEEFSVSLPTEEFDRAIKKVAYAAGRDEAKYILTGVLVRSFEDRVHVVATDGHRLALYEIFSPSKSLDAIIPRKSLSELKRLLREGESVEVVEKFNKLYFRVGDTVMWSSLIEGEYPDYTKVIPENNSKVLTLDREEFLAALKEVSVIFEKEEVRAVLMEVSDGNLFLTAKSIGGETSEEAEVQLPVDYSGEPIRIGFNIVHLIESVSSFSGETIALKVEEPTLPALIVSEQEPQLKNVIMPMKV
ncbi:DNA polymerase III subunit beta [Thermovibrio sp.]